MCVLILLGFKLQLVVIVNTDFWFMPLKRKWSLHALIGAAKQQEQANSHGIMTNPLASKCGVKMPVCVYECGCVCGQLKSISPYD